MKIKIKIKVMSSLTKTVISYCHAYIHLSSIDHARGVHGPVLT